MLEMFHSLVAVQTWPYTESRLHKGCLWCYNYDKKIRVPFLCYVMLIFLPNMHDQRVNFKVIILYTGDSCYLEVQGSLKYSERSVPWLQFLLISTTFCYLCLKFHV